ncbi:MAG: hypothetical protein Q7S17_05830 [Xanthobacteraceae bacterium]|nr:hypothetical protein [Xanthobacteraceae bacterium]
MAVNRGMLSGLFAPQGVDPEQAAEEKRLMELGRMNPFEADAYTAYSGGAQAGRGLGKIAAGLTGRDVRPPVQKRSDAIEAAKAQVAQMGFDPEDPKSVDAFYKQVIQILQKQGLAGEALDVAREWHTQKTADEKGRLEGEKLKATAAKDVARNAQAEERNKVLKANGAPELAKMIDIVEGFDPITQAPQRKMRLDALNAMMEAKKKGIVFEDLGDRIIVRDRGTGTQIGTPDEKGAAPMNEKDAAKEAGKTAAQATAYRNAMSALQSTYNAAVRLYNHSGIGGITGRLGRLVGEPGVAGQTATTAASADSRAALALWKQIAGTTFLEGLNQLKAASPVGSTGLGQVSNIEGEKVQSAAAALSREQDAPDFRLNLKVYLGKLAGAAQALAAAAPTDKVDPIPLREMPLTEPIRSARGRPAAAAPAAAPAAPGSGERWERVNGKLQKVQ